MGGLEHLGRSCTSDLTCNSNALHCLENVCACIATNGYLGENCSQPSGLTNLARIVNAIALMKGLTMSFFTLKMIHAYVLPKIAPFFGAQRRIYAGTDLSQTSSYQPTNNKINVKLNAKDYTLLSLFLYYNMTLLLNLSRTLTLTIDPHRNYEEPCKPYLFAFRFIAFTLTQLNMGLAWMETGAKCEQLSFLKKYTKRLKLLVNIFCLGQVVLAIYFARKGMLTLAAAVFQLMLLCGAITVVAGGKYLTNKMLSSGSSGTIQKEAQAIKTCVCRMATSTAMYEIMISVLVSLSKKGLLHNIAKLGLFTCDISYGISLMVYLDRRGKVFAKAQRQPNPTRMCVQPAVISLKQPPAV